MLPSLISGNQDLEYPHVTRRCYSILSIFNDIQEQKKMKLLSFLNCCNTWTKMPTRYPLNED